MTRTGSVYLLHFGTAEEPTPYKHAGHYLGWAADLDARLAEHAAGRGARLLQVARDAGITWTLARTWPGTRARERQLKNQGGASRRCPMCGVTPREPQGDGRMRSGRDPGTQIKAAGELKARQAAGRGAQAGDQPVQYTITERGEQAITWTRAALTQGLQRAHREFQAEPSAPGDREPGQ